MVTFFLCSYYAYVITHIFVALQAVRTAINLNKNTNGDFLGSLQTIGPVASISVLVVGTLKSVQFEPKIYRLTIFALYFSVLVVIFDLYFASYVKTIIRSLFSLS